MRAMAATAAATPARSREKPMRPTPAVTTEVELFAGADTEVDADGDMAGVVAPVVRTVAMELPAVTGVVVLVVTLLHGTRTAEAVELVTRE